MSNKGGEKKIGGSAGANSRRGEGAHVLSYPHNEAYSDLCI